jgi:uncharacterized protein
MSPVFLAGLFSVAVAVVMILWWMEISRAHALHDAAGDGNLDRIETLISSGYNADTMYDHVAPLHVAVMRNRIDAAKLLISHGASVNLAAETEHRETPLYLAATTGNRGMLDLLLASGANLEATDAQGNNLLFRCILADEPNAVDMLLDAGMDPNCQDPNKQAYALHAAMVFAIHYEKTDLVETLLRHGADPNVRDQHGMTPMKMLKISGKDHLVDLLMKYGAKG